MNEMVYSAPESISSTTVPHAACRRSADANKYEKRWALAIALIVFGTFFANFGQVLEGNVGISQQWVSNACKALIVISLATCLPSLLHRDIRPLFFIILTFFFSFLFQSVVFSQLNPYFYPVASEMLVLVLPVLLCLSSVDDFALVMRYLYRVSVLIACITLLSVMRFGGSFLSNYSMGLSDSLVIPTDVLLLHCCSYRFIPFRKTRYLNLVLVIACGGVILLFGSRGAFASIAVFSLFLFLKGNLSGSRKAIWIMAALLLVFVGYSYIDQLLNLVLEFASGLGINSRSLRLFINTIQGEGVHLSGRLEIWTCVRGDFLRDILAIRGVCSTYPLVGDYSHNIVLDILHNFGALVGSLILMLLVYFSFRTVREQPDAPRNALLLIFFFSAFPLLFWSGTIWTNVPFWSWIVLLVRNLNIDGRL